MFWIIFSVIIATNLHPCHLTQSCVASCNDPNATPNECGSACQPTCAMPDPQVCTLQCVINACECNEGYILDKTNGTCILKSECPNNGCNGDPNAHATECVSCDMACEDNEPISCAAVCLPGCDCNDGYTYSKKLEKCILSTSPDCVPCPENQRWSGCIERVCAPSTCKNVGYRKACIISHRQKCTLKGCICKTNYVKDSNDVCIPVNECPSCGGDSNATGGCDVTCKNGKQNYCTNYEDSVSCDQSYCDLFGCECKDGYVYNNSTSKCVNPCDC